MNKEAVIRTVSGKMVDVVNPDPGTIDIKDIAWALAGEQRFGGHLPERYTVAEHSIWVCELVRAHSNPGEGLELEGLLHDSAEAYLRDMPSPIKDLLPEYQELEESLLRVIGKKFKATLSPKPDIVAHFDRDALCAEWWQLMTRGHERTLPSWPDGGYRRFLELYDELKRV